jgi:hypothetical protein
MFMGGTRRSLPLAYRWGIVATKLDSIANHAASPAKQGCCDRARALRSMRERTNPGSEHEMACSARMFP